MTSLHGKRIIVTGAGRGIGRAVALACARAGATVGAGVRALTAETDALRQELTTATGTTAHLLVFDVRDAAAVTQAVDGFAGAAGGIEGLVNNAGVPASGLLATMSDADIRTAVDTNLVGPLTCTRAVLPAMMAARTGVVINVGSVAAERPFRGQTVYAATKGALEAFTRALAVEVGQKGIRAHCVRPGAIATDMLDGPRALGEAELIARVPLRRLGRPDEIASLVVFLLGDDAGYTTGTVHTVDGGYHLG